MPSQNLTIIDEFLHGATVSVTADISKLTQNTYITGKLKLDSIVYEFESEIDLNLKRCVMSNKSSDFPIPVGNYEFIITWWTENNEPISQKKYQINVLPIE